MSDSGNIGVDIAKVKTMLKELGYNVSAGDTFDERTQIAIESFQNDYSLKITGKPDLTTYSDLQKVSPSLILPKEEILPTFKEDVSEPLNEEAITTATTARPTLKLNYNSEYVRELQEGLIKIGYLKGKADAIFGKDTENAVKAFQAANGLAADGVVGAKTWALLDLALNGETPPTAPPQTARPIIKQGSKGEYVKILQSELKKMGLYDGTVDGDFGSGTTAAVKEFQKLNNLTPDGIVGASTWELLDTIYDQLPINLPVIKEGATGEEVEILQTKLLDLDYYTGSVTGSFGSEVTVAVKAFQRANGIVPDGVVGAKTWKTLYEQARPTLPTTPIPESKNPILKFGDKGQYVGELQRELTTLMYYDGAINENFDQKTLVAVKSFQDVNKLTADGVVGRTTWYYIDSIFPPPVLCP